MIRQRTAVAALTVVLLLLAAPTAQAHPLGNFTTNTSATILPADPITEVIYVLDLAEIPTQQSRSAITAAGGQQAWAEEECGRIAEAQALAVDGEDVELTATAAAISFPDGEAGLGDC